MGDAESDGRFIEQGGGAREGLPGLPADLGAGQHALARAAGAFSRGGEQIEEGPTRGLEPGVGTVGRAEDQRGRRGSGRVGTDGGRRVGGGRGSRCGERWRRGCARRRVAQSFHQLLLYLEAKVA
jgi:hypothetical protein